MRTTRTTRLAGVVLAASLALTACGGKDKEAAPADPAAQTQVVQDGGPGEPEPLVTSEPQDGASQGTTAAQPTGEGSSNGGGSTGRTQGGSSQSAQGGRAQSGTGNQSQGTSGAGSGSNRAQAGGDGASCPKITTQEAFDKHISKIPRVDGSEWLLEEESAQGFDPCADLSWIVIVPRSGGTAGAPYQIMLFHDGRFLGATLSEPKGFAPEVKRLSDSKISVGYRWIVGDEPMADPKGSSTAYFEWDAAKGRVVQTGQLPPN